MRNDRIELEEWQKKICASYEAGIAPSYDDMEGALLAFLNENARWNQTLNSMAQEFSHVLVARLMNQDEKTVLAALDAVIARRTSAVLVNGGLH